MDSTAIATIEANTAAVTTLSGVLLVFMGVFIVMTCGYLIIRYTLRG